MKDLAVLFPCFNGGARLRHSVESCAASGLAPERYSLIVIDNCSTDGSIEELPRVDSNNVPIQFHRNDRNLGRVANWNRALEIAEQEGYKFAAFLFVGDTWAADSSIGDLLNLMEQNDAVLGMAPLRIVEEDSRRGRDGARISIPGSSALVNSASLLEHVVRVGRLPFAPIQANVYRLFRELPLRFDDSPDRALNTDIESTVGWLRSHPGKVALLAAPFLVWSGYSGRFLNTQDPWFVLLETRASLQRASEVTGVGIDWESANAVSLLTSARELMSGESWTKRFLFFCKAAGYLRTVPGGIAPGKFLKFMVNKLVRDQSYLSLPEGSAMLLDRERRPSPGRAAILTRYGL